MNDARCHDCSPHMKSDGKGGTELAYVQLCSKHRGVEWRPIETAPKTGESVLLAHGNSVWEDEWYFGGSCWARCIEDGDHAYEVPSHWMPLPEPPLPAPPSR